jgi:hypothetical protein
LIAKTFNKVPDRRQLGGQNPEAAFENKARLIRNLIWLYIFLWIAEGGLRRWFLPGLAGPLLFIRDPLILVIYGIAWNKQIFPGNNFVVCGAVLAALTFMNAMVIGHANMVVAVYGVRCDFLHVPLIFIMSRVIRPKDLIAFARIALIVSIPYTALLVAQFYSSQDSWVNRGVGGSLGGAGFDGAMGRFRPPGTFSFITGVCQLYALLAACWFVLVLKRKVPAWLSIVSGVAILVAIPISISRTMFLNVALVSVVGIGVLLARERFSAQILFRVCLAAIIIPILALRLAAFKDGMEAFGSRWQASTTDNGGFQEAIVDRLMDDFFGSFAEVQLFGLGTGFSTHVGQQLLTQTATFGASEGEWGRLLFDNGLILGVLLLGYRVALIYAIISAAFQKRQWRSPSSSIFAAAAFFLVCNGQWGQTTTLGSAVICAGFALAAANHDKIRTPRLERSATSHNSLRYAKPPLVAAARRITVP